MVRHTRLSFAVTCLIIGLAIMFEGCGGGSPSTGASSGGGGNSSSSASTVSAGNYIWQSSGSTDLYVSSVAGNGVLGAPVRAGGPAMPSTGYRSLAVGPSRRYLYAFDTSFSLIRVLSLAGPGVQVSQELTCAPSVSDCPYYPESSHGPLNSLSLDPTGKFLYIVESPASIEMFVTDDSGTGGLRRGPAITENVPADLREGVITPSGKFLFVNDLTAGRIFGYNIGADGSLSAVQGSPFSVPLNGQPTHVILDSSGLYLYAPLYAGGIAAFSINGSTGALTNVPGSPFPTTASPGGLAAAPGGYVYVTGQYGVLDAYKIGSTGALTPVPGSPFATADSSYSIAVDATGTFVYVGDYAGGKVYGFNIDAPTGSLTPLPSSPFPSIPNPNMLAPFKVP